MGTSLIVLFSILGVLVVMLIALYNALVSIRNQCDEANRDEGVALQDAHRAGLEAHHVLQNEAEADEGGASHEDGCEDDAGRQAVQHGGHGHWDVRFSHRFRQGPSDLRQMARSEDGRYHRTPRLPESAPCPCSCPPRKS